MSKSASTSPRRKTPTSPSLPNSPKSSSPLPLVSVIIPVYNVKDYLPRCLDSIRSQTYKNLQIILIDDGSTDASSRLCDIYAKLDPRALVVHEKNAGLSAARNRGIDLATGKYLFFLDSDDYLEKDCLEYLYKLLYKSNSKISFCSHYLCRAKTPKTSFNPAGKHQFPTVVLSAEDALAKILNEHGATLSSWNKLFSADLFATKKSSKKYSVKKSSASAFASTSDPLANSTNNSLLKAKAAENAAIRFPVGKVHEDVGTTYRLFLRAFELDPSAKIAFGKDPKYFYNLRPSSLSRTGFNMKKLDLLLQTDQMCADLDAVFPRLKNTTHLRRLHARFSILRQLIPKTHKTEKLEKLEDSLVSFILDHKEWITKNPEATRRDKLAFYSLMFGKSTFSLSWKIYEKLRKT